MFHGTTDRWAEHIVNNGQRADMGRGGSGALGPGLYLTNRRSTAEGYAHTRAMNSGWNGSNYAERPAVVEGVLDTSARVHRYNDSDEDEIRSADAADNYGRALLNFNARIRKSGYNVVDAGGGMHVAIRPNVFLPTKVHFDDGTVDLR